MELLPVDLILSVFEGEVKPVQNINCLNCLLKELWADHTLDDVLRQNILHRDDQLMQQLVRHHCQVLHHDWML